ncbi:MAG TPA: hypothetical protein VEK35_01760, partial [Roseiarcus sp.]|nr:hypothetical protein [Roseiarcus sp.]
PAFEAARYLPVYELTRLRIEAKIATAAQPPVFICATAENDWATGYAFPLGSLSSLLTESWLGWKERQAMLNTVGHLPWMTTHALASPEGGSSYQLAEVADGAPVDPFWVVRAAPAVIDGHNGIFQPPFLHFVADQVFRHVQYSRLKAAARPS